MRFVVLKEILPESILMVSLKFLELVTLDLVEGLGARLVTQSMQQCLFVMA